MKELRINAPGAGQILMDRIGGSTFRPGEDHSISSWEDGKLLGGFVFTDYMGNSLAVHDAAFVKHWCSRDMLWMVFHYAFKQLGCGKLVAPVASNNHHAMTQNLRAGFRLEAVIKDLIRPGVHLMVLTMVETDCRWLGIIPTTVVNNPGGAKGHDHGW